MSTPLSVVICEDNLLDADDVRRKIEACCIPVRVDTFLNGADFLASFGAGKYDVLFLDVYLGGSSGIEIGKTVREKDPRIVIALFTSSSDHALESYRLNALKYLLKPADPGAVRDTLDLALALKRGYGTCAVIVDGVKTEIPHDRIYYVESHDHHSLVYTMDGVYEVEEKIGSLEILLPAGRFFRCHRSYIVGFAHVRDIDRDFVMTSGDRVYIRNKSLRRAKEVYADYLYQLTREKKSLC